MQRTGVWVAVFVAATSMAVFAGSIQGKVNAAPGVSVVWVNAISGKTFPAPTKHAEMDQKGLMFQPHILAVQLGTSVDFLNSDNVAHNVFWPSVDRNRKLGHNMGTWPKGVRRPYKFDHAGVVPLLCNVHPEMSGYIIVSPTPYFAESNASGEFTINNVPDGKYTVTAWHEGAKTVSKSVTVSGGQATVDFKLSR